MQKLLLLKLRIKKLKNKIRNSEKINNFNLKLLLNLDFKVLKNKHN